jgi:hypothetical protein
MMVNVPPGYAHGRVTPMARLELVPIEVSHQPKLHEVFWGTESIGYVWLGQRRYSPPIHKGSRIVRYHKMVPEWQGGPERYGKHKHWGDTRQMVLQKLLGDYEEREDA